MAAPNATGPQERILDAAERVFAECGFEGASLRHIVREASVNLAAVHYYYHSKEGLMEAVFRRRFGPLRAEQLRLLRQFEQEAGKKPLAVEKILEAMLVPALRLADTATTQPQPVLGLVGRIASEPNPQVQALIRQGRQEVRTAVFAALRRSLPHSPLADLHWQVEFVWGALVFMLCNPHKLEQETNGVCRPSDSRALLGQMIRFFGAGFREVTTPKKTRNPKSEPRHTL